MRSDDIKIYTKSPKDPSLPLKHPIPLPASPLKGEDSICGRLAPISKYLQQSVYPILFLGFAMLFCAMVAGCSGSGGGSTTSAAEAGNPSGRDGSASDVPPPVLAKNVVSVTVNGALCSPYSYPNKPCVSVTVCTPGTDTCQTINDIILDTGSFGLRIFKQALAISLPQVTVSSGALAECVQFADGSSDWGPVQMASVILGNEPAVQIPIHVIDSTFGTVPVSCGKAMPSPAAAGYSGILGVGFFTEDCGPACTSRVNNGMYYACSGPSCSGTTVPLSSQVQNPVAHLPEDNNGLIVQLPKVPPGGSPWVDGYLVLGINTQPNNTSSTATTYNYDKSMGISTHLNGVSYNSFIDSGSNGLYFPPPSASLLPNCSSPNAGWFCPPATVSLYATTTAASGSPSGTVSFQICNLNSFAASYNRVSAEIGGTFLPGLFDWGLPFFFGRDVYVGFEGKGSNLGTGPYYAY